MTLNFINKRSVIANFKTSFSFSYFILFLLIITNVKIVKSQSINFSDEINFVSNLVIDKNYRTAINVCNILKFQNISKQQRDSLNFLEGWSYYNIKKLDSAATALNKIDSSSAYYFKSQYYSALCNAYQQKETESIAQIKSLSKTLDTYNEFPTYTLASYYLINRNVKMFDSLSKQFTYSQFPFAKEEQNLFKYRATILKQKNKSQFVAGALSAVVPGLGKYYAGYRGQAISALLPTAFFALYTAEAYYRMNMFRTNPGVRIIPFIAFGGAFSLFYIGNIVGSAKSVKTFKARNKKIIDNEILLDLHIAQRRIFD